MSLTATQNNRIYTRIFAFFPLLLMYKTPGLSVGLTTSLIAITIPIAIRTISNKILEKNLSLSLFVLYILYVLTKSTGQNIVLCVAIMAHLQAINRGIIDLSLLKKIIINVSAIAAICVTIQQLFHTLFGIHIPFVYGPLFLDSLERYKSILMTGIGTENMYRPCAFFLEPAHFSQYSIIGLGLVLFNLKPDYKKAVLISMGLLLSTSGMGAVLTFGMWGWWIISFQQRGKFNINIRRMILGIGLLIALLYILQNIPFFNSIFSRFTTTDESEYNAIHGRLLWWESYFGGSSWNNFLLGFGIDELPEVYFTGFMKQLFAYGIIGTSLFISFLLYAVYKMRGLSQTLLVIYIALLFLTELTGFIPMIFYIGTAIALSKENTTVPLRTEPTLIIS
ncbi:MAG: hypothetical protein PHS38_14215 [Bacteroidales bacterium]|nr:hypothetical protein [Bacteroidales bacterium]